MESPNVTYSCHIQPSSTVAAFAMDTTSANTGLCSDMECTEDRTLGYPIPYRGSAGPEPTFHPDVSSGSTAELDHGLETGH